MVLLIALLVAEALLLKFGGSGTAIFAGSTLILGLWLGLGARVLLNQFAPGCRREGTAAGDLLIGFVGILLALVLAGDPPQILGVPLAMAVLFTVAAMALHELREMDGKRGNIERLRRFFSHEHGEDEAEIEEMVKDALSGPLESGNGKVRAR